MYYSCIHKHDCYCVTELFGEEQVELTADDDATQEEAAVKIQAAFRGMQARQQVKTMKEDQVR